MNKSIKFRHLCLTIICLFTPLLIQAQNIRVTGTIYDQINDQTVIGASVLVKGTQQGTITDLDGNFFFESIPANSTLQVSFVGYKTQEVTLNGRTNITINLQEDTQTLDELVVVGYGTMRKSDLTGAVGSVKTEEALRNTPTSTIASALQGRLAGVSITNGLGDPSSNATIRVRGVISIYGDDGPLVVVDGIPGGSLSSINPSDIVSVEVLKDASSTAIYGYKGANGVILVTTKNPDKGKITVEYNGYANFKSPIRLPEVLSPGEFAEIANEYRKAINEASGQTAPLYYTEEEIATFKRGENTYDYLNNIFRDVAIEQNHELSISGGSESTHFLFSGSFTDNNGIAYNSNAKRANYRLKVDTDIRKWLKVGINFWGDYSRSYGPRFSQYNGVLIQALTFPNTILPRVDGDSGDYNNMNLIGPQHNPMLFINEMEKDRGYVTNNRLQGYFEIEFIKGLTFRMTQSFLLNNRLEKNVNRQYSYDYYQNNALKTDAFARSRNNTAWTNINTLSYVREFNKDHRINAVAAFEQDRGDNFMTYARGLDLLSPIVGVNQIQKSATNFAETDATRSTNMSVLGRINYVLMNRYMLTASIRWDGTSRFMYPHNTWDSFPSMAVAWNIKEEKFMETLTFLDQFKLRFGYGESGNQNTGGLYRQFNTIEAVTDAYNQAGSILTFGNPNIHWERTKQYNYGVDLSFFANRLTLNMDIYNKTSIKVLAPMNQPLFHGESTIIGNSATIQNKGVEFTIGADPIRNKNLYWHTDITLSHNTARIKDLPDNKEFLDMAGGYENNYFRNIKGEKVATIWGYKNEGVWTTQEIAQGLAPAGTEAGSYKYQDIDGNEGIDANDKQVIGNGQPAFQWGWNNSINYKNFDFGLAIIGIHGFDIYNYTREARFGFDGAPNLGPNPEWKDRWIAGENENSSIAGFVENRRALTPSSQYVEKGDFVKIKSITVGYTLPTSLVNKADISRLRIYASIQNPFLITKYSGTDPEVTLKNPLTSGIDWGYYPNGRNILIGLNLTF